MIITKTPYRVSFFGGGTDYPVWLRDRPGAVLSTTINRYCYISCLRGNGFNRFIYGYCLCTCNDSLACNQIRILTCQINLALHIALFQSLGSPCCQGIICCNYSIYFIITFLQ